MAPLCGLPRAAVLCQGAEILYSLVGAVHGLTQPPWSVLGYDAKHAYYRELEQLIVRLRPLPAAAPLFDQIVAVARAEAAAKVVGRITPSEPWGLDSSQGRD